MEITFRDRRGILRELTEIFYQFGLNIEGMRVETDVHGIVKDFFVVSSPEEDYYIFERLIERVRFEIPEMIDAKLISLK